MRNARLSDAAELLGIFLPLFRTKGPETIQKGGIIMLPIYVYALIRLFSAALVLLGAITAGRLVEGAYRNTHNSNAASRPHAGQVRRSPSF